MNDAYNKPLGVGTGLLFYLKKKQLHNMILLLCKVHGILLEREGNNSYCLNPSQYSFHPCHDSASNLRIRRLCR